MDALTATRELDLSTVPLRSVNALLHGRPVDGPPPLGPEESVVLTRPRGAHAVGAERRRQRDLGRRARAPLPVGY